MIVTEEQVKLELQSGEVIQKRDPDGPPPYELASPEVRFASTSSPLIDPPIPTDVQPSNFVSISRTNDSIRSRFVIDTSIHIPLSLLPELDTDSRPRKASCSSKKSKQKDEERLGYGERPNLQLSNTNGSIAADIWIINREGESTEEKKRAFVEMKNTNGSLKAQIVTDSRTTTPFALSAHTTNGSIQLFIPRSFTGPLTIRKGNGSVKLSPSLESRLQIFSDIKGKRICFVGDFRAVGYGEREWKGSAIEVGSTNGSIRIFYVDDEAREEGERSVLINHYLPGFWSKLFGGGKIGGQDFHRP